MTSKFAGGADGGDDADVGCCCFRAFEQVLSDFCAMQGCSSPAIYICFTLFSFSYSYVEVHRLEKSSFAASLRLASVCPGCRRPPLPRLRWSQTSVLSPSAPTTGAAQRTTTSPWSPTGAQRRAHTYIPFLSIICGGSLLNHLLMFPAPGNNRLLRLPACVQEQLIAEGYRAKAKYRHTCAERKEDLVALSQWLHSINANVVNFNHQFVLTANMVWYLQQIHIHGRGSIQKRSRP